MTARINWYFTVLVLLMCYYIPNNELTEENRSNYSGETEEEVTPVLEDMIIKPKLLAKKEVVLSGTINESEPEEESDPFTETSISWEMAIKDSIAPRAETFRLDTKKDNLLECKQGTKVHIPKGAFTGNDVKVEIKEYYSRAELLSADLSTVSNNELLESGGTVYIEAKDGDTSLELNENKELTVYFPKKTSGEMSTFYGERTEDGIMNWTEDISEKSQKTKVEKKDQSGVYLELLDGRGFFRKKKKWLMGDGKSYVFDYFNRNYNDLNRKEYLDVCLSKYRDDPKYMIVYRELKRANVQISSDGKIQKIKFHEYMYFEDKVNSFMNDMPPVNYESMRPDEFGKVEVKFYVTSYSQTWEYRNSLLVKNSDKKDAVIDKFSDTDMDYFVLDSKRTGWINCDRIYGVDERIDLMVNNEKSLNARYYLFFEGFNGMVCGKVLEQGSTGYFRMVPKGEKVKLLAISMNTTIPMLAVKEVEVDEKYLEKSGYLEMSGFKPFSVNELSEALN
ncbi:MAG: hypothetical protein WDZ35_10250 [Crocinitomicaceae bacterium]